MKDWRNKAGIYWEGADLLGTGGQGSINLVLPLGADLTVAGHTLLSLPVFLSEPSTQAMRPWHPVRGHFISSLSPVIRQRKQLPTFT